MRVVEIIFSPTGGTQKVAEILTGQWNEECTRIDLTNPKTDFSKSNIEKDDLVLIAMPVFATRPPAVAIDRLKQIDGKGARSVLLCVYGNGDYGNTLSEMFDAAEESGFQVTSAIAAIAQHSIIPEYANGRPDNADSKQLIGFAKQIKEKTTDISAKLYKQKEELSDDESHPEPPAEPPIPKATETCLKCGICVEKCPVEAISHEDFACDINKCIFCMRCIRQCPNKSRKVDEKIISMAALSLKEMCSVKKDNELFL